MTQTTTKSRHLTNPCVTDMTTVDGITVISVCGDLNQDSIAPVRDLLAVASAKDSDVIVDLAKVEVIDSAGLGALVRAHRDIRKSGRVLCFAAPSRFVRVVLHTMRLDSALLTFDDLRQAQTWLDSRRNREVAAAILHQFCGRESRDGAP